MGAALGSCSCSLSHSFMGRGVIDLPVNEIAAAIFRVESSRYWNKFEVVSEHLCTRVVVILVNIIGSV